MAKVSTDNLLSIYAKSTPLSTKVAAARNVLELTESNLNLPVSVKIPVYSAVAASFVNTSSSLNFR